MREQEVLAGNKYLKVKKRVEKIKEVYIHLAVFILTMPIIIITNIMFVPGFYYFWFALFGWLIGVSLHWLVVIGIGEEWEERTTKELLEKEDRKNNWE